MVLQIMSLIQKIHSLIQDLKLYLQASWTRPVQKTVVVTASVRRLYVNVNQVGMYLY